MNIKLRHIQPGQRFEMNGQNFVRIAHAESVGLDRNNDCEETVWFFNLDDSTVNYAARHSRFEYLLDIEVELHPFDAGRAAYGGDVMNPYPNWSEEYKQFELGHQKAYEDDFDYQYGKLAGGF